jgi:CHAP domain
MNIAWEFFVDRLMKRDELTDAHLKSFVTTLAPRLTSDPAAQKAWVTLFDAPTSRWRIRLQQALALSGLPDTISESQWRQWLSQAPVHIADHEHDELFFDALQIAATRINCIEWPPTWEQGQDIVPFFQATGMDAGDHWCMAFVYWAVSQAVRARGDHHNPLTQTGHCYKQWKHAEKESQQPHGSLTFLTASQARSEPAKVRPGAIFILQYKDKKGHTGFVQTVQSNGDLLTIEGNTNHFGWPQVGLGVYQCHHRKLQDDALVGFILNRSPT